jgi:hypothetical protein
MLSFQTQAVDPAYGGLPFAEKKRSYLFAASGGGAALRLPEMFSLTAALGDVSQYPEWRPNQVIII